MNVLRNEIGPSELSWRSEEAAEVQSRVVETMAEKHPTRGLFPVARIRRLFGHTTPPDAAYCGPLLTV